MMLSKAPGRASRVARRGTSNILKGTTTTTDYDIGNNGKAGSSCMGCVMTAAHSDKS
jgi:hypothetical protein